MQQLVISRWFASKQLHAIFSLTSIVCGYCSDERRCFKPQEPVQCSEFMYHSSCKSLFVIHVAYFSMWALCQFTNQFFWFEVMTVIGIARQNCVTRRIISTANKSLTNANAWKFHIARKFIVHILHDQRLVHRDSRITFV